MNYKNRRMLVPKYMDQFKCIGSSCEDTCCAGWRVNIDKKTYKKYKGSYELELKDLFKEKVKKNDSNTTELNYAEILLDEQGVCPFLTNEKLCNIQQKLGFEALSITCTTYPRVTKEVNGVIEMSATISCPEVARLILLNPEPMEFDEIESKVTDKFIIVEKINTEDFSALNKPEKYFWELRIFTIKLLQNRNYKLWERLVILGLFYQKVQSYYEQNRVNEILDIIVDYENLINSSVYNNMLNNIPTQINMQMKLLQELTYIKVANGVSNKRYGDSINEFLSGINYSIEAKMEEIGERYKDAYNKYYEPYMRDKDYILENYLVNYVFKNMFPISGEKNLFDNYVLMIVQYALIKMHLIGIARFNKENFNVDKIIKLIQSLSKTFDHDSLYLRKIIKLLKAENLDTMAYMTILIKN